MLTKNTAAQRRSAQRKKGFTLTEIAIVLGIVGLLLGAIWVAAAAVYQSQRVSHANTAVLQIMQGARGLYATSASTGVAANTDLTPTMVAANIIPQDLVNGTAATAPWPGSAIKVLTPATADSFTVEIDGIPQAACVSLIATIAGNGRDPGLFSVGAKTASAPIVAGTAGTALATATAQIAALNGQEATTACSGGAANFVQFGFSIH